MESLVQFYENSLGSWMPREVFIFLVSMVPLVELRGGLVIAKLLDVGLLPANLICIIGNIVPIPFILLFIRRIFAFLKRFRHTRPLVERLEAHSRRKSEKVRRLRNWGLLLLVAIPLPGTGGWTGALVAALLDIRMRTSLPIIAAGVLIAGLIMTAFSYGLLGLIT